jgi:hypothetical protein
MRVVEVSTRLGQLGSVDDGPNAAALVNCTAYVSIRQHTSDRQTDVDKYTNKSVIIIFGTVSMGALDKWYSEKRDGVGTDVGRNEERVEVNEGDGRKERAKHVPPPNCYPTRRACVNIFLKRVICCLLMHVLN